METKQKIMTLDQLSVGESCEICQVGNQRGAVKRRLVDMGLTPGTVVTLVKIAPFGDPMELRLRGYELSLRKEDAAQIRVRPAKETTAGSDVCEKGYHITSPCSGDCAHCAHRAEEQEAMRRAHEHEQAQHPSTYDPRAHDQHQWKVALAGNPNCGKTTLFNALTGSDQYVGNWPGVTVEKKEGTAKVGDVSFTVVDLPGIYSLSPYSMEELVARRFIIGEKPDAIINIVDATNLERNLYLTMQLLELERPMVLALNFMDEVEKKGDQIDCGKLAAHLGVPVIPISARDGQNIDKLVEEAHRQMHTGLTLEPDDLYDDFTHLIHHRIGELIHDKAYAAGIPAHWAAIKLLEGDSEVAKDLGLGETTLRRIDQIATEYEASSELGDRETLLADSRYRFVERVVRSSVKRRGDGGKPTITERIDAVATHKYFALPLFLAMMLVVFLITFSGPGAWLSDGIAAFLENVLCPGASAWLNSLGAPAWLTGLLVDGLISGVGGVITFLPMIALLFLFLSLLEDSGYMARAAFVMDRTLRHFGLSGKAFIPMLMGFGCTVPAVMGARTMENEKDRRMTICWSLHVLRRPSAHLRPDDRSLLPGPCGADGVRTVPAGTGAGLPLRPVPQAVPLQGGAGPLPAGAAPLPDAHGQEHLAPRVAAGPGLPHPGGHHHRRYERGGVVPPELRPQLPDGLRHGGEHPGPVRQLHRPHLRPPGLWRLAGGGGVADGASSPRRRWSAP